MLRAHHLMPTQLYGAYGKCTEVINDQQLAPDVSSRKLVEIFGAHPLEFLGLVPGRSAPNSHSLPDRQAVYRDAAGLLYFPHRDSEYEVDQFDYDLAIGMPPAVADVWVCKKPEGAVHSYRTGASINADTVLLPVAGAEVTLTPLDRSSTDFVVQVQRVLERYDGCCVLEFNMALLTNKNGDTDTEEVLKAINKLLE